MKTDTLKRRVISLEYSINRLNDLLDHMALTTLEQYVIDNAQESVKTAIKYTMEEIKSLEAQPENDEEDQQQDS